MFLVIAIQRRAAARVGRVEEKILHIDRNKFFRVRDFVQVRTAHNLVVVLLAFATAADVLLPASQIKQARVITQGEASFGLTTAFIGQADQASTAALSGATLDQRPLCGRPEAGAVVKVGQFMQHGSEQFTTYSAVWAICLLGSGRSVCQPGQQLAVEIQL